MSGWLRIVRGPDGGPIAPDGLGPDEVCFVDAATAAVSWARSYPTADGTADARAAHEWAATAQAAVAALHGSGAAVVGDGALAALVRVTMPSGAASGAVIETTGAAEGVAEALRLAGARCTVVLAARPLWRTAMLRTYDDVHRRGLRLVAVPWVHAAPQPMTRLAAWALARLGDPAAGPAVWHRLTREDS